MSVELALVPVVVSTPEVDETLMIEILDRIDLHRNASRHYKDMAAQCYRRRDRRFYEAVAQAELDFYRVLVKGVR